MSIILPLFLPPNVFPISKNILRNISEELILDTCSILQTVLQRQARGTCLRRAWVISKVMILAGSCFCLPEGQLLYVCTKIKSKKNAFFVKAVQSQIKWNKTNTSFLTLPIDLYYSRHVYCASEELSIFSVLQLRMSITVFLETVFCRSTRLRSTR